MYPQANYFANQLSIAIHSQAGFQFVKIKGKFKLYGLTSTP